MKIVIGHLFYDLLNLYGESGNILALEKELKDRNLEVEIKEISLEEELNLNELDFVYIGSGTENNLIIALDYLKNYKEQINKAINENKIFLATGNAIELFGKEIINNDTKIETLGCFDFYTKRAEKRIVAECTYSCNLTNSRIIGFTNHQGITKDIKTPLFIKYKEDSSKIIEQEGIHENNFFGTYLIGPLLVRNPELLKYITDELIKNCNKEKITIGE